MLRSLLYSIFMLPVIFSSAQQNTYNETDLGVNAGLQISLGSHVQGIGLFASAYYGKDFYQFNSNIRWTINYKNIGQTHWDRELQIGVGIVAGFGQTSFPSNRFLSLVSNQTGKKYSFGYGYKLYFDNKNTSQRTGIIGFQIDQLDILHENDILAVSGSDRYRSAGLYVGYRIDSSRIGINTTLWHGNSNSTEARNVYDTTFSRYGYKDLSKTEHGKTSHGLLSLQVDQAFIYGQTARVNLGVDAEKVRNVIQNKIIHDMYFLPQKWIKTKNLHIPMLDENGDPYIYVPEQKLRKSKLYIQSSLNSPTFY